MGGGLTPSQKIAEAALRYATGGLEIYDGKPLNCLKVTRLLVQEGLGWNYDQFYALMTERVEGNETGTPWARSMQRSLRSSPYAERVPWEERGPGMLVFSHSMALEGHVAVIVAREGDVTLVIENTGSQRGRTLSGFNRQSQLESWPTTDFEVFRLVEP